MSGVMNRGENMISCGPVTLRPIEYKDMDMLRELINDPEIASSVVGFGFPVSAVQQKVWFENIYPHENAERFMIEAEGKAVGSLVFDDIDRENRTGEVGYKIARPFQGHRYASYAVRAVMPYLFDEKGIECIIAYHLDTNDPSKRVLEKAGFIFEGVQRKAVYRNGIRMGLWYWSCSREHYQKIREGQNDAFSG